MDKLEKYWKTYDSGTSPQDSGSYYIGDSTTVNGFTCSHCGKWVNSWEYHYCCPPITTWISYDYPTPNKTEQAFKILKALVESKIIREPQSFKKFCDLIEKIAGII